MIKPLRPVVARIDASALAHNLGVVRRHCDRARVFAAVKANAYGHGLGRAVEALEGADGFALIEADAAVSLRERGVGKPLLVLEGIYEPREIDDFRRHRLIAVIHSLEQVQMLRAGPLLAERIPVFLKVDTGMNRLGLAPGELAKAADLLKGHARVVGLLSHLADVDDPQCVGRQLAAFREVDPGAGLERSLANSGGVLAYPDTHFDWVRPGIMLYGCSPFEGRVGGDHGLEPVMTLASKVIELKTLQPGDRVGYGGTFTAKAAMRIANVAGGYADGYPRSAPEGTPVLVDGRRARLVGRVSMDKLTVDVTGIDSVRVGSEVVFWGKGLPVEEVARAAGTISYELLARVAPRVRVEEAGTQKRVRDAIAIPRMNLTGR